MIEVKPQDFKDYVIRKSSQDIFSCFQCKKCSAGCPVAPHDDMLPHEIHRLILYNKMQELLNCAEIWLCTGCEACGQRCPNGINTGKVNDVLKQLVMKNGGIGKERRVSIMHSVFLSGIQKRGRMHEISLMKALRLRTGGYFKDMALGIRMFRMGKLSLYAERIKSIQEIRALFKKAEELS